MTFGGNANLTLNQTERHELPLDEALSELDQLFARTSAMIESAVSSRDVRRAVAAHKAKLDAEHEQFKELQRTEAEQRERLRELAERENLLDLKMGLVAKEAELVQKERNTMFAAARANEVILKEMLDKL